MFLTFVLVVFSAQATSGDEKRDLELRYESPEQEYFDERRAANKKSVQWSYAKRVRWSLQTVARTDEGLMDFMSNFVHEDRPPLQAIIDLDRHAIEAQAAKPILREMCAVPRGERAARGRLFTRANAAQTQAVDAAVDSHLARLTLDGSQRIAEFVEHRYTGATSSYVDWESLVLEVPDYAGAMLEGICFNLRSLLDDGVDE